MSLQPHESYFLKELGVLGLPVDNVLASLEDRQLVLKECGAVLQNNPVKEKWASKFMACVASGLFDAALEELCLKFGLKEKTTDVSGARLVELFRHCVETVCNQ